MNINVYIERLVLDGLPVTRAQGALVQAALEMELAHLLGEGGLASSLQAGGALPSLRADGLQFKTGTTPAQMGIQIAQAVYKGIGE